MDTADNANVQGYLLLAALTEGDKTGKLVAYCYVRLEIKENIGKVLLKFCEDNNVSRLRIVMVDQDLNEMNALKDLNQRTIGPVNAHLISLPSKAQNINNQENIW